MSVFHWYIAVYASLATVANSIPQLDFVTGVVPLAEFCLPSANLTELSGCVEMTEYHAHCRNFSTDEEKIDCFCQQEMLSDYYKQD